MQNYAHKSVLPPGKEILRVFKKKCVLTYKRKNK